MMIVSEEVCIQPCQSGPYVVFGIPGYAKGPLEEGVPDRVCARAPMHETIQVAPMIVIFINLSLYRRRFPVVEAMLNTKFSQVNELKR